MKQSQLIYFITEWAVKVDGEGKVDEAGARRPEGSESSEGGGIALRCTANTFCTMRTGFVREHQRPENPVSQ